MVVDTEEMDEAGEGGRGMSQESWEGVGALEMNCSLLERLRYTAGKRVSWDKRRMVRDTDLVVGYQIGQ
jgi:hypothetical protein